MLKSLHLRILSGVATISLGLLGANPHLGEATCEPECSTNEACNGTSCFPQSKCSWSECAPNPNCKGGAKDVQIINWEIGYCGDGPNPGVDCIMNPYEECARYPCACC
jgi:hypothetical protein